MFGIYAVVVSFRKRKNKSSALKLSPLVLGNSDVAAKIVMNPWLEAKESNSTLLMLCLVMGHDDGGVGRWHS